ncbi:MAG: sugar phosphate isomerase/epimerase [Candidatus Glassbacteria bacterium]|nr:sugar phosphate isomerase/epimerase [Candidatus Glassbacteria bacterium]
MKLGVHAYVWTSEWNDSRLGLIERCGRLGLDLIEIPLMRLDLCNPDKIRRECERVGIAVCTSTVLNASTDLTSGSARVRQAGTDYLKACVEATARMGGDTFSGVIYSEIGKKSDERPGAAEWKHSAEGLKEVCRYAQEFEITVGIEPVNRYETYLVNTCEQALELIGMIGEPNAAVHLDTYHMNIEEKDFYEATRLAGERLCHYHLCENDRGVPGTGLVDWDGIFRALGEMNYSGNAALESFVDVSDNMREATCVWRDLAPSGDVLVDEGARLIRELAHKYGLA